MREREKERFILPLPSRRRERGAGCAALSVANYICFGFETHPESILQIPGCLLPAVAQRGAVRVVPLTADVFPNCLRQRLRELTRRNHLLLALAQVRSGLILRVEGSAGQLLFCGGRFRIAESVLTWCFQCRAPTKRKRKGKRTPLSSMNLKRNEHNGALNSLAEPSRCAGRVERRDCRLK